MKVAQVIYLQKSPLTWLKNLDPHKDTGECSQKSATRSELDTSSKILFEDERFTPKISEDEVVINDGKSSSKKIPLTKHAMDSRLVCASIYL